MGNSDKLNKTVYYHAKHSYFANLWGSERMSDQIVGAVWADCQANTETVQPVHSRQTSSPYI